MPGFQYCYFPFCKSRVERHFSHLEIRVKKKSQSSKIHISLNATRVNVEVKTSIELIAVFASICIYPLNSVEVLKILPDKNADRSFNKSVLNDSVLKVLRQNCEVGVEHKRK